MFSSGEQFVIHKASQTCAADGIADIQPQHSSVQAFVKETYPKQKHLVLIFDILEKHNLFDDNLFCIPFPNIHVADMCAFFLNRFYKNDNADGRYIKFCKFLQKKGVKLPKVSVKNPYAQKLLCWISEYNPDFKKWALPPFYYNALPRYLPFRCVFSFISTPPFFQYFLGYTTYFLLFRTMFFNVKYQRNLEKRIVANQIWNWAMWTMPSTLHNLVSPTPHSTVIPTQKV